MKKHFKKHKYKIVIGIPLIATFLTGTNLALQEVNTLSLIPQTSPFITQNEDVSLKIVIEASQEINVIGSLITYPKDILEIKEINYDNSVIDLWAQKPSAVPEFGIVSFGGGIIAEDTGFTGTSTVFNITFSPISTGVAKILLEGPVILAHDGTGDNIITNTHDITLYIRNEINVSPDVNDDGVLSLADVGAVYTHTMLDYNPTYDIDGDGHITISDVTELFALLD